MDKTKMEQLINQEDEETETLNLTCTGTYKIHVLNTLTTSSQSSKTNHQKICPLDRFTHLHTLVLSNHMIRKIENLEGLDSLRILNLEFNRIQDLQNLDSLSKLEQIYLSYNQISTIKQDFHLLFELRVVHLAYNQLRAEQLIHLAEASELVVLTIQGNPLTEEITYETVLGAIFHKLTLLDQRSVNRLKLQFKSREVTALRNALNQVLREKDQVIKESLKKIRKHTLESTTQYIDNRDLVRNSNSKSDEKDRDNFSQQRQSLPFSVQKKRYNKESDHKASFSKKVQFEEEEEQRDLSQAESECNEAISEAEFYIDALMNQNILLRHKIQELQQKICYYQLEAQKLDKAMRDTQRLQQRFKKMQIDKQKSPTQVINQQTQRILQELQNKQRYILETKNNLDSLDTPETMAHQISQYQVKIYNNCESLKLHESKILSSKSKNQIKSKNIQDASPFNKLGLKISSNYRSEDKIQIWERTVSKLLYDTRQPPGSPKIDIKYLEKLHQEYKIGLIQLINQLSILIFNKQVGIQEMTELGKQLGGKCLLQLLIQKSSEKQRKQRNFNTQKQSFIRSFEQETLELAAKWEAFHHQRDEFKQQVRRTRQQLKLALQKELQQDKYKVHKEKIQKLQHYIQWRKNELNRMQAEHERQALKMADEIAGLDREFERKYSELGRFEKHFMELKAERKNMVHYQGEIQSLKQDKEELEKLVSLKRNQLEELEGRELVFRERVDHLENKAKERLSEILQIDSKHSEVSKNLSTTILEYNKLKDSLADLQVEIKLLGEEKKECEKSIERVRASSAHEEERLSNLQSMWKAQKEQIRDIQKRILYLESKAQEKQRQNESLLSQQETIKAEYRLVEAKLVEGRLHMQNLENLNATLQRMSLRERQMKQILFQLQVQVDNKNKLKREVEKQLMQYYEELRRQHNLGDTSRIRQAIRGG